MSIRNNAELPFKCTINLTIYKPASRSLYQRVRDSRIMLCIFLLAATQKAHEPFPNVINYLIASTLFTFNFLICVS